jgi:hypothetical protein
LVKFWKGVSLFAPQRIFYYIYLAAGGCRCLSYEYVHKQLRCWVVEKVSNGERLNGRERQFFPAVAAEPKEEAEDRMTKSWRAI